MAFVSSIFAPSNQPALFPMAIPVIPKEDYNVFYKKDRDLFTHLLVTLHREAGEVQRVMGFFIWLEKEGYTLNLVQKILDLLPPLLLNQVIDEAVTCLMCVEKKANIFSIAGSSRGHEISLLQSFLDRKNISLQQFYENRDLVFNEVSEIVDIVCATAFKDIVDFFIGQGGRLVFFTPDEVIIGGRVGGYRYIGPAVPFPSYDMNKYVGVYPTTLGLRGTSPNAQLTTKDALQLGVGFGGPVSLSPKFDLGLNTEMGLEQLRELHHSPIIVPNEEEVPSEDRTIFLTFSRGYPVSEREVRDFFTSEFGDFIEAIYMQEATQDEQPLYARVVARSLSMMRAVIERDGPEGKSKYNIGGKHVWARRFEKKNQMGQYLQQTSTNRTSRLQPTASPFRPFTAAADPTVPPNSSAALFPRLNSN